MIVKKTDPISGRRLDFEVPEPFPGPQDLGANESLLFPEDVLRSDVSYKDPAFVEDVTQRQDYQLLPFYQGLRGAAGTTPAGWWGDFWASITSIVDYIFAHKEDLASVLQLLVSTGVITPAEKEGMTGLTAEQVVALIEAKLAAEQKPWEKWLPWIGVGGAALALILALALRGRPPVYVIPERK